MPFVREPEAQASPSRAGQSRAGQSRAFALTWLSYASYYFARKGFPVAKSRIGAQLGLGPAGLAALDTGYLSAYAFGQFACGWLGDRVGARRLVGVGMIASGLACAACGTSRSAALLGLFFAANGLLQATGWPGNVKAMAAWFGPRQRGSVMGFWSTCFQVGPLVATALATFLLHRFGWRAAFFGPAGWVVLVGFVILLFLREGPEASRTPRDERCTPAPEADTISAETGTARRAALANPVVWLLGLSYFGMKLIRYCIDFWQPYYLHHALGYSEQAAGYASTAFQFGGIFGAIAVGFVSDRWFPGRRGAVAACMTLLLALSLALYGLASHWGMWGNAAAMALVGFCLFGPDALISGVAAQDLGGRHAASTVAGFINGCGSVGAIAQGALVAGVSARFGWQAVFQVLMVLAGLSSFSLLAVARLQARRIGTAAA